MVLATKNGVVVVADETVTLTSGMTDVELIGYCLIHCETPRALFSADQVNRMLKLSGCDEYNAPITSWVSVHEEMAEMCKLARCRMESAQVLEMECA